MTKEIEVKIKVNKEELDRLERELDLVNEVWKFERVYGFFTPDGSSIEKGIFPRIKSIGGEKGWMDVKVKGKVVNNDYFERTEYRIYCSDIKNTIAILTLLGYSEVRIFEKFRKKVNNKDCEICLDKLPFGYFIEIESSKEIIEKTIKLLKLTNNERITKAYLKIADEIGLKDAIFGGGDKVGEN